jgi:hypothetical protein
MAHHLHKQIRDALVLLLTGLTTSAARVYANRLHPMAEANLPGLRLFADEERAEALTLHTPHQQERSLAIVVECCAKAAGNLDDTLDLMSKEVEVAMAAGITLGGQQLDFTYTGMQFDDEQSDKPVGVKRLTFSCTFTAMNNAPDVLT